MGRHGPAVSGGFEMNSGSSGAEKVHAASLVIEATFCDDDIEQN